ncbi:hypothetical protein CKK33_18070 [Mucilaginibacter sp. MD40]|uniref:hypothetical protein n=1 Tax=Mucilaginibacter sp. MD40 TaxID=2029590 RepID=UPI000BAC861C|nr:hypothetical protein [Mucilaginibacter sp. MD40]PAW95304.1 hypothetical protein CKK33_18070 [Mucilaginibacter sp. MD40]
MFKRNNFFSGILLACLPPLMAWLLFAVILKNEAAIMEKPAAPYLIALCINLLILRYYARKHFDATTRGIMVVTFAFMILVFLTRIRL